MEKVEIVARLNKLKARRDVVRQAICALEKLGAEYAGAVVPYANGRAVLHKDVEASKGARLPRLV